MDNERLEQLGKALGLQPRCVSCGAPEHLCIDENRCPLCLCINIDYSWLETAEGAAAVRAALAERCTIQLDRDKDTGPNGARFCWCGAWWINNGDVVEGKSYDTSTAGEVEATLIAALRALERGWLS